MKKTPLSLLIVTSLVLASCTMPWTKTAPAVTEEIVPADDTMVPNTATTDVPATTNVPAAEIAQPTETDTTPSDTPKAIAEGGIYLPYTSTAVAQAKGNVVLFFHASWCPTCVAANKDIEAHLKDIPKNLTILKVNYDEATDLKKLYEVTGQHTFVQVDNSGKLIKKWRGGSTLSEVIGQTNGVEAKAETSPTK